MSSSAAAVASVLRTIPDFPQPGIQFKDIGPLMNDPKAWETAIDDLCLQCAHLRITKVVGMEARGFLVGMSVANKLKVGFVAARKPGKLPGETHSVPYGKEYGKDVLEMSVGLLKSTDPSVSTDRVLIVDDLLATGGTAEAAARLVKLTGATTVGYAFIIELTALDGRKRLETSSTPVFSVCQFD